MGRRPKRPTKATIKTAAAPTINKAEVRLAIAVLFALWIVVVFVAGWGDYRVGVLESDISIWNSAECKFADAIHIIGVILSIAIIIVISILQFAYLKSKLLTWIIVGIPVLALVIASADSADLNAGSGGSLVHCVATVVVVSVGITLIPFFLLAAAIIRVAGNMWHFVFGKRK